MVLTYELKDFRFGYFTKALFENLQILHHQEISPELFHNLNITLEKPVKIMGQQWKTKENKIINK